MIKISNEKKKAFNLYNSQIGTAHDENILVSPDRLFDILILHG